MATRKDPDGIAAQLAAINEKLERLIQIGEFLVRRMPGPTAFGLPKRRGEQRPDA